MTINNFFTATGNPAAASRALSSLVRAEFVLIDAAFLEVQDVVTAAISGAATYAVDTGIANAYVVSVGTVDAASYIASYTDGLALKVRTANPNSGGSTIAVNALGAKSIVRSDGSALQTGDILANNPFLITYNSSTDKFYLNMGALGTAGSAGAAGANATSAAVFGDGSDGNVTISAGTTTLSRNMFYNNLTINGTGSLDANGWQISVKGTLDLTAAPAGAIKRLALAGGNATTGTGGSATAVPTENTVGAGGQGAAGPNGTASNAGTNGTQSTKTSAMQGGLGGASATAGTGGSAAGAAAAKPAAVQSIVVPVMGQFVVASVAALAKGGVGGSSGPSGGGGGAGQPGGGGGAGGNGGGVLDIRAGTISRGAGTAVGAIQCIGGAGGAAGNGSGAGGTAVGGGSGGAGGGGGLVNVAYTTLSGATATNCIDVSGGVGGAGGTAINAGTSGSGASGGDGGQVRLFNMNTAVVTMNTSVATGSAGSGTSGGAGGVARYDL